MFLVNHGVSRAITTACIGAAASLCSSAWSVIYYVDADIVTSGTGTVDWSNAFKTLQHALTNPVLDDGDEIWVKGATGNGLTYYPDLFPGGPAGGTDDPVDSFVIDTQIVIRGQYTGSMTTLDERNPTYRSILSGAIAASESSYSVVRFVGTLGSQTVLDGLEIRDGVADGGLVNPEYGNGAGVHVGTSAPDIRSCRIIGNRAVPNLPVIADQGPQDGLGGGVYARNGATLTLRGCEIADNIGLYGAGFVLTTCH